MTLPRKLVSEAVEIIDILYLEDETTDESMEFITFGDFDYEGKHYFYGMDSVDYEKCFGIQKQRKMSIQFLEEVVHDNGEVSYSTDVQFTSEDEQNIYDMIKSSLESIVAATKYGIN